MAEDFDPAPGAAGFVISTPSILALASLFGALECYLQCGKVGAVPSLAFASDDAVMLMSSLITGRNVTARSSSFNKNRISETPQEVSTSHSIP